MNRKILITLFVALLIVGGASYYINHGQAPASTTDNNNFAISSSTKVITFNITAKKFEFDPATITVNKGEQVVVNITSTDATHGFAIDEYGINETIQIGTTKQIKFVADKPGTFTFYCTVPCGPGHFDMKGNLVVLP